MKSITLPPSRFLHFCQLSVFVLTTAASLFGESTSRMSHSLIAPNTMGIVDGRPTKNNTTLEKNTVLLSTGGLCTGFVVEGCILTAAHCVEGTEEPTKVYSGLHPDRNHSPIAIAHNKNRRVKSRTGTSEDLAVIKTEEAMPMEGYPRTALAKKPLPPGEKEVEIAGYGLVGTREVMDAKQPENIGFENYGAGIRRTGTTWFKQYSCEGGTNAEESKILATSCLDVRRVSKEGQILNLPGSGDSGGPLVYKDQIYGIASAAGDKTKGKKLHEESRNSNHGLYASISHNYDWIIEKLDELDCKAKEVPPEKALAEVTKEIWGYKKANPDNPWNAVDKIRGAKLQKNLIKYLKLEPGTKLEIFPLADWDTETMVYDVSFFPFGKERSGFSASPKSVQVKVDSSGNISTSTK